MQVRLEAFVPQLHKVFDGVFETGSMIMMKQVRKWLPKDWKTFTIDCLVLFGGIIIWKVVVIGLVEQELAVFKAVFEIRTIIILLLGVP